ncbi:MAG TPA: hypothetical protein VJG32_14960 [Anaerolineae bacterium]|nr:hypothetical protein [Anaerolineae bacterium]
MEWWEPVVVFLAGMALRFAIPLGLTILAVWWLRRLDARWQAEAKQQRVRILNADEIARYPRCWETRHCPPERMAACPAYAQPDVACWQVFRSASGRLKEDCLDCAVFHNAPAPHLA